MPYTCRRCGLPVPQGLDVCPNCGAVAQRPDAIIRCRHCHRRAPSHLAICPHCGRRLRVWRPDAPLAAIVLLILVALWLGFGDGARLFARARARLVALLPPPATLTPVAPFDATPTPEEIALIPTPDLQAEPPPAEIEPLDIITATEPLTVTAALTPTLLPAATLASTVVATATVVTTTTVSPTPTSSATLASTATPTPTPIPSATATPLPTATATPISTSPPTASPTPRATLTSTRRPPATPTPSATPRPSPTSTRRPSATPTPSATPRPSPTSPTTADAATYTIQLGDTLLSIAQRVGRTVEALAAFNNISDPRALKVGQTLRIPPADYTFPTPTSIPTRPTATRTPTPPPAATPAPAISLPAPILVSPGSGSSFTGSGSNALIYLKWQNPGGIPESVNNILHIGVLTAPDVIEWRFEEPVGQATDYKLPAWLFGQAPQEFGRTYVWYVQVVADNAPLSPPSPQWRFQWD